VNQRTDGGAGRTTWRRALLRGLNTTAVGNAQAFGFSVTITVSFGIMTTLSGQPTTPQMIGFGLAAVAAFSLLNITTTLLVHREAKREPRRVVLLATATDFLAVGSGSLVATAMASGLGGWVAWLATPFCVCLVYIFVQSAELAVGERRADD
jgi:hypothetical protein